MSRKLDSQRYEELKVAAADLIEDYGIEYPLDPFRLATNLGMSVTVYEHGLPDLGSLCDSRDGITVPVVTRLGIAYHTYLNGRQAYVRQRFTMAHELAHVWLNHLQADFSLALDTAEGEANFFASYLLAPDALVLEWIPNITIQAIASTFHISDEAAGLTHKRVMRAMNLWPTLREYDQRILDSAAKRADAAWMAELQATDSA